MQLYSDNIERIGIAVRFGTQLMHASVIYYRNCKPWLKRKA